MAPRTKNPNALPALENTDTIALKKKSKPIRRIALVTKNARAGFAAAGLQDLAPVITVNSLEELTDALVSHHRGTLASNDEGVQSQSRLIAFDMTSFDATEIHLLGGYLSTTSEVGAVYLFTPTQFEFFNDGIFDLVIG
jgi:hypothetical protein